MFIEIGCDASDSDVLTALPKHGGAYARSTRKMQASLPRTGESKTRRRPKRVQPHQKINPAVEATGGGVATEAKTAEGEKQATTITAAAAAAAR